MPGGLFLRNTNFSIVIAFSLFYFHQCKHAIHSNPNVAGLPMAPKIVSELRVDLPPGHSRNLSDSASTSSTVKTKFKEAFNNQRLKRSSYQHHVGAHTSTADISELDDQKGRRDTPELDLTLGRELAGGGISGKRAKLGKLIIENEGLEMMDLIVAANMSLWWRIYARTAAGS